MVSTRCVVYRDLDRYSFKFQVYFIPNPRGAHRRTSTVHMANVNIMYIHALIQLTVKSQILIWNECYSTLLQTRTHPARCRLHIATPLFWLLSLPESFGCQGQCACPPLHHSGLPGEVKLITVRLKQVTAP